MFIKKQGSRATASDMKRLLCFFLHKKRFLQYAFLTDIMNSDSGKTLLGRDDAYEASAGPPCEPYRIRYRYFGATSKDAELDMRTL
jgi:hypothetical protein